MARATAWRPEGRIGGVPTVRLGSSCVVGLGLAAVLMVDAPRLDGCENYSRQSRAPAPLLPAAASTTGQQGYEVSVRAGSGVLQWPARPGAFGCR